MVTPQASVKINVKIKEKSALEGPDLRDVINVLDGWRKILAVAHLNLHDGKHKAQKSDKFRILTTDLRKGSADIDFVLTHLPTQLIFAAASVASPADIWQLSKSCLEFLIAFGKAKKEGKDITVNVEGNENNVVIVVNNGNNVNIDTTRRVVEAAWANKKNAQQMANAVNKGNCQSVTFTDRNAQIALDKETSEYLGLDFELEKETVELTVNVFDFNKNTSRGYLEIIEPIEKVKKRVPFRSLTKDKMVSFIESMKHKSVRITALEEVISTPTGDKELVGLALIEIELASTK